MLLAMAVMIFIRYAASETELLPLIPGKPAVSTPAPVVSETAKPQETEPTPEPTPTPTPEPQPEYFTITAIGDLTLANCPKYTPEESAYSFTSRMNGDYSYPFKNTVQYFENDELTIANLECNFLENTRMNASMYSLFYFPAPMDRVKTLTAGSIDFVTTANNHLMTDYNEAGANSTYAALESEGIPYGTDGQAQIITTENGLKVGIYTAYNGYHPDKADAVEKIQQMKADGAEYIICMFHWPQEELTYIVTDEQKDVAHACVDAGANLIYGSHPHVLEPMEEYNGAIILYSMGNFSFGGNTAPKDKDTCIAQIVVKRDLDGTISNDGYVLIPTCVSSRPVLEGYSGDAYNDYCPTPYTEGSEAYERALSKINGSYTGGNLHTDYTFAYTG